MADEQAKGLQLPLPEPTIAKRRTTADLVFTSLRQAILSGELPGGTHLVEAQLAARYQVSKTPVREALQRLAHQGLVDFEVARGASVHTLNRQDVADIYELRVHLEPLALRQSAPHLSEDEIKQLGNLLTYAESAIDGDDAPGLSAYNNQFHRLLLSRATNQMLIKWIANIGDRHRLISHHGWQVKDRRREELAEHHAILRAVKAGDVDAATVALARHIANFADVILAQPPDGAG